MSLYLMRLYCRLWTASSLVELMSCTKSCMHVWTILTLSLKKLRCRAVVQHVPFLHVVRLSTCWRAWMIVPWQECLRVMQKNCVWPGMVCVISAIASYALANNWIVYAFIIFTMASLYSLLLTCPYRIQLFSALLHAWNPKQRIAGRRNDSDGTLNTACMSYSRMFALHKQSLALLTGAVEASVHDLPSSWWVGMEFWILFCTVLLVYCFVLFMCSISYSAIYWIIIIYSTILNTLLASRLFISGNAQNHGAFIKLKTHLMVNITLLFCLLFCWLLCVLNVYISPLQLLTSSPVLFNSSIFILWLLLVCL